jgi:hypothetical protein
LTLASAQRQEVSDWVKAYQRYIGGKATPNAPIDTVPIVTLTDPVATSPVTTDPSTSPSPPDTTQRVTQPPPPVASPTDPYDPNGFYASSYGSASAIYCADDSAWQSLSPAYLQHFATWDAAIYVHSGYHLHQPC